MQRKRYLESNECKGTPFKAKEFASLVIKKIMFTYVKTPKEQLNIKTKWIGIKIVVKMKYLNNHSLVILGTRNSFRNQHTMSI